MNGIFDIQFGGYYTICRVVCQVNCYRGRGKEAALRARKGQRGIWESGGVLEIGKRVLEEKSG